MQIKTPVQFGRFDTLEDADGMTILDLDNGSSPFPETKQAIIDTFEDAARWQFLGRAANNQGGPEELAMIACGKEMGAEEQEQEGFPAMTKIVDLARARLAAK